MFGAGETNRPGGTISAALAEAAGAALYSRNPFRITGVATDADRRTIRQRRQQIVTRLQIGADIDLGHDLDVGPDEVGAAFDRLQGDPRIRLVDELFWLWDTPDARCSCPRNLHHEHDQAVRAHCAVLEREATGGNPTGQERADLEKLWSETRQLWRAVLRRAVFWDHVRHRVEALDDRQLSETDVDVLRRELPTALVKPLIELAVKPGPSQGRLAGMVRGWPMVPGDVLDDLLEEIAAPIYEETRAALADTMQALGAGEPGRAHSIIDERVLPSLLRLAAVVPHDRHRPTAGVRNEAAIVLNNCATALLEAHGPAAEARARRLLGEAGDLTTDSHTKERVEQNRTMLDEALATFETVEQQARTFVDLGRPDLADEVLRKVRRALRDQPWIDQMIDELAGKLGISAPRRPLSARRRPPTAPRPSAPAPRRPSTARRELYHLIRYLWWVVGVPLILIFLLSRWFGVGPWATSTAALFSEVRADNAAVGSCLATKEGWEADHSQVPVTDCDEPHWGEVLGYVSLGEIPSSYPGGDQLQSTAAFECSMLQARQNLNVTQYTTHYLLPGEDAWNDGGGRFENYTPCVLSRRDDKSMTSGHVADPPPRPESEVVVPMNLYNSQKRLNPPVGTCVKDKKSWDPEPYDIPIVRCELPHWAEIVGYPELFGESRPWPGDDKVWDAAKAACEKASADVKAGEDYRIHINWPDKSWWGDEDTELYAVCLVSRGDDKTFSGGLR